MTTNDPPMGRGRIDQTDDYDERVDAGRQQKPDAAPTTLCDYHAGSSRICEQGTRGCVVHHKVEQPALGLADMLGAYIKYEDCFAFAEAYAARVRAADQQEIERLRKQLKTVEQERNEIKELFATKYKDGDCHICHKPTVGCAGNPGLWPYWLSYRGGNGKCRPYHMFCLIEAIERAERVEALLEKYGQHRDGCQGLFSTHPCVCGLRQALAPQETPSADPREGKEKDNG